MEIILTVYGGWSGGRLDKRAKRHERKTSHVLCT